MKKILFTFALLLTSLAGFAQKASDIVDEFKNENGVEVQVIPRMMLQMGLAQAPDEKTKEVGKKMDEMTAMSLGKASEEVRGRYLEKVATLTDNGYELYEEVEEGGAKVKILTKTENDVVTELVNVVEAGGEFAFIIIKGKFTKEDMEVLKGM